MKTSDEFLEELKEYLVPRKEFYNWNDDAGIIVSTLLDKIEQFQAEQKQVKDESEMPTL